MSLTSLRRVLAGLGLALLLAGGARAQDYVPGEVLVRWKPDLKTGARTDALAPIGASLLQSFDLVPVERLAVPGMAVEEAVARLAQDPRVEYVEPNYLWSIHRVPNDPSYPEQYGLHNEGQTGGVPGADISAEGAWDRFTGDPALLVGDLDTGADYDHPDLAENIWTNPGEIPGNGVDDDGNGYVDDVHGYDFVNHDPDPRDDNGHGTHTAGTIAAVGNNGVGVTGVVWHAKIVLLKFLNAAGSGPTSAAVEALQYGVRMGVRLTNNSWGGGFYSRALEDAIAAAGAAGQLFVAAAGNSRSNTDLTPNYPSALPEDCIIAVAATDNADQLAGFSNYGATTVDLAAPGVDILSTFPGGLYHLLSGTSMATPHVTGAAAYLMGRFPGMAAPEVKARLLRFADPKPALAGRCVSGGRLNLDLAASDPDSTSPGAITGLTVVAPGSNSLDLEWTATGDDSTSGTATSYELRYATSAFDTSAFATATLAVAPRPLAAGTRQAFRLTGLATGTTYWLALRARDEFGNRGGLSEVVSATTLGPPHLTLTPASFAVPALTGTVLTRSFEIANDSPGTLEWSASRPVLDFGTAQEVWPGIAGAKGDESAPREPQAADAGGPDAFGYRWTDSAEPDGPRFVWADIVEPANQVALSGDEAVSASLPIGFSFPLYGRRFTQLRICTNGYLQFGNDGPLFINSGLPSGSGARNMVAPFWDDLHFGAAVNRAYIHNDGARCIVSFDAVPRYNDLSSVMTFQAILYPSGEIRFQYLRMTGNTASATVGIQDSSRTTGLLVAFNQAYVRDSLAVRIVPLPQWLAVAPGSGFLAPGARESVELTLDATGLATGTYVGRVRLATNDPAAADTAVSASLAVTGAPDILVTPASLEYGSHFAGGRDTLELTVANRGVDPLVVSGVASDATVFRVPGAGFTLLPGEVAELPVVFVPDQVADLRGTLTVDSNDPDQASVRVALHGVGSTAPVLETAQSRLAAAAAPALRADAAERRQTLVIRNPGGAPLEWTASTYQGLVGTRPAAVATGVPPPVLQVKGGVAPGVGTLGDGGPDAFGYRWVDSDAPGGPAFAWDEIATTGTRLFGSVDDSTTRIALPFPFTFYGVAYDSLSVCTNGWVSFTSRDSSLVNSDLPSAAEGVPRALVAPYWTDLDLRTARGSGSAYALFDGSKLIVEWKDAVHFSGASPYTFEVFLWPSGAIEYQYLSLGALNNLNTVGLQDSSGTVGLRIAYNVSYAHAGLRVRISHQDDWLKIDRAAGTIAPGGADTLGVTFDARQYHDGDYAGEIRVASNDVNTPLLAVPCAMHVGVLADTADASPGAVGAVSVTPVVRVALSPPAPGSSLVPGSLRVNGAPVRLVGEPSHDGTGRLALELRAVDLLGLLPGGAGEPVQLTGELDLGGWFSAGTRLDVTPPALQGGPIPAFGSERPKITFRGNEAVDLSWIPPAGGADLYEVAYSSDGGLRWTPAGHGTQPRFGFIPPDTTSFAMLEVLARLGDAVVATWLSAPFAVDLEVIAGQQAPPARFALRLAGPSPAHGRVALTLEQPEAGPALVEVYDVRGARVRTLFRGSLAAARHALVWDGRRDDGGAAPPGVYLLRARWRGESRLVRTALLR